MPEAEQMQFNALILRHFAQVSNVTRRYTDRLGPADREHFMERSLQVGFLHRAEYNPATRAIAQWWEEVCNIVALTRNRWRQEYSTGSQWVAGKNLGVQS